MNFGNIEKDTAAGRLFSFLDARRGEWVDGWTLTVETRTTAVSTRISEVRAQVDRLGLAVETKRETDVDGRPRFLYRLVEKRNEASP